MGYQEKYERWLSSEKVDQKTKDELRNLTEDEIKDRFYTDLTFGTGGLRAKMAAGTNRLNIYTVRLATQGLANEIIQSGKAIKGVVVAYDSRNNSALFAKECAKVLCGNNIKTYLFDSLRPTPELSFAVRYLGCARGVVITASHNPKEYNGYKVYGEEGAQIDPETAKYILSHISQTDIFDDIKISDGKEISYVGSEIDDAYIEAIKLQSLSEEICEDLKVVYTPLHGAGNLSVQRILKEIGVKNLTVVAQQELPDGNFPTVLSPNPENEEAFILAIECAKQNDADIIIGTDPDSDRIGVVVRDSTGRYIALNGNQTGTLLCEYILSRQKDRNSLPADGKVIKTIVTTEMVRAIAQSYEVETVDVLTGFKFIGEKIKEYESSGIPDAFLFGLEESYGYLKGTYARDKDAVVAAMLIIEIASECKKQGITLYDHLCMLYEKYGYYLESLESRTLEGIDGRTLINKIMHDFRTKKPVENILKTFDYANGLDGLPPSDVLKFFTDSGWFAVRPSGTEPKIKFYFGVCGKDEKDAERKLSHLKSCVLSFVNENKQKEG